VLWCFIPFLVHVEIQPSRGLPIPDVVRLCASLLFFFALLMKSVLVTPPLKRLPPFPSNPPPEFPTGD
jgi:hypothetical protein